MFKRQQRKDIPRCALPWRPRSRKSSARNQLSTKTEERDLEQQASSDFIADNFDFLEIRRAVTPPWAESETAYAALARAAGLTSPATSHRRSSSSSAQTRAAVYTMESTPPPLPDKPVHYCLQPATRSASAVDMRYMPERNASKHVPSHSVTSSMDSSSSTYTHMRPAVSPATTPSIGSSFLHRRAGSTTTKPPPPPLLLHGPPRKGSLPSLQDWHSRSAADPVLLANMRERSASLPMNSLETMQTKEMETIRLSQLAMPRRRWACVPDFSALELSESLVEKEVPMQPQIHISKTDSKDGGSSLEIARDYRMNAHLSTQTESSEEASQPRTAESAARTSSILSRSQAFPEAESTHHHSQNRSPRQAIEVTFCLSSSSISADHGKMPTSARPSKVESVVHESLLSPGCSLPSQESHTAITSGSTDESFDLSRVPFSFSQAPPIPMSQSSHAPRTPLEALLPLSPSKRTSDGSRTGRRHSVRSRRTRSGTSSRRSLTSADRHGSVGKSAMATEAHNAPSTSRLVKEEPVQRPFPWKPVKIAEAKKKLTAKQLQHIVLESMRGYSSMQQPAFVLEGLDEIPLELQHCRQRIQELELAYLSTLDGRKAVLNRHIACLQVLNGDQGARFGESLVSAVSRSDRCAQEISKLWEHVLKLENLRDGHWRAAASLSLAKLNSSYLKAKDEISSQSVEITKLKAERDEAVAARDTALARLKFIRDSRGQSLTVPAGLWENLADPTPSISAFDLAAFPTPPVACKAKEIRNDTVDLSTGLSSEAAKSLPPSPPAIDNPSKLAPDTAEGPSPPSDTFCSLPTPSLSSNEIASVSLVELPGSGSASKLKFFTERVLTSTRSKSDSPAESELPWARANTSSSTFTPRTGSSRSTPADTGRSLLDPLADQFSSEIETLKFVPPSMHISSAWDAGTVSMRSSLDLGLLPSRTAGQDKRELCTLAMSGCEGDQQSLCEA